MSDGKHVRAHAKVNLRLEVFPPREDGLHPIDGVFLSISLADELTLRPLRDPELRLLTDTEFDVPAEDNMVSRAARAYLHAVEQPEAGLHMELMKRIPVQAGLGGGSADAAATLLGLQGLYGVELPAIRLEGLARTLGSDVSFCLRGGLARVRGTGEELESLEMPAAPLHLVVVKPRCAVSTPWAYQAVDLAGIPRPHGRTEELLEALASGDERGITSGLFNALEHVVECRHPEVRDARLALFEVGAVAARMTGSGSAVFGLFPDEASSHEAVQRLAGRFAAWACRPTPMGVEEMSLN